MNRKIITYSLLAHINNSLGGASSYERIFIPLVKRALSKMCSQGQFKGNDINDIKQHVEELYNLDIPISVLKRLLSWIENEINHDGKNHLQFYSGGAFIINKYVFDDFEEEVEKKNEELDKLQNIYESFLQTEGITKSQHSIFEFVEGNKISLGKYINKKYPKEHSDNTLEARFVNFIKPIEGLYNILQSVYVGSIISTYLEFEPNVLNKNIELVLDTNFVIGLLDLNTRESMYNCSKLLTIGEKLGYKFSVLGITMQEIDQLLKIRVGNFESAFLSKILDPEDIYNACDRRGLNKTDLDRIRHTILDEVQKYNISVIHNTEKYENKARFSHEFERLKEKRNTRFAALHDATCIEYVKEKRTKTIYEFDKVNCWFVNNSSARNSNGFIQGAQPIIIKAEDFLNMLWLASPMVQKNLDVKELANIGLTRLVASTLCDSLPSAKSVKQLDDNIQKYAKDNISDEDIVRVAKGLAQRTITNLDSLNSLAENNTPKFVETLQSIANEQQEKEEDFKSLLNQLVSDLTKKSENLHIQTEEVEKQKDIYQSTLNYNEQLIQQNRRIKAENILFQNQARDEKRRTYIEKKIFRWRLETWIPVLILFLLPVLIAIYYTNYYDVSLKDLVRELKNGNYPVVISFIVGLGSMILSCVFLPALRDKYFNLGLIEKFETKLEIPEEFREIEEEVV